MLDSTMLKSIVHHGIPQKEDWTMMEFHVIVFVYQKTAATRWRSNDISAVGR